LSSGDYNKVDCYKSLVLQKYISRHVYKQKCKNVWLHYLICYLYQSLHYM
jgi:hypothetical protein